MKNLIKKSCVSEKVQSQQSCRVWTIRSIMAVTATICTSLAHAQPANKICATVTEASIDMPTVSSNFTLNILNHQEAYCSGGSFNVCCPSNASTYNDCDNLETVNVFWDASTQSTNKYYMRFLWLADNAWLLTTDLKTSYGEHFPQPVVKLSLPGCHIYSNSDSSRPIKYTICLDRS